MGSEAELYFDNIPVDWAKNAAPEVCRVLFKPSDFLQVPFRKLPAHLRAFEKKAREYYDVIPKSYSVLCCSASAAERRLSILGYSRERAEEAWHSAKTDVLLKVQQYNGSVDTLRDLYQAEADLIDAISYKEWQTKYAEILKAKPSGANDNSDETFIFLHSLGSHEVHDPIMWAAIQLYALEPTKLWVDLTEVIVSEYETKASIFGEDEIIPDRFKHAFGKITLLTEGVTDSRILSASLNEFYPEARDLYSFVDFEGFKVEGGASPLAKLLRGFAGAGLTDRYVAIFDNDAAGHEAFALVKSVALPPNIRAMTLPDLEFARNYPTIGPTGKVNTDINGSAVSIETFLGRDALIRDGKLRPVRWSQWNNGAKRYQGEIEGKHEVCERYLAAIKEIKNPKVLRRKFADMDALLCTIFGIFA
jgi:hypothetical protein